MPATSGGLRCFRSPKTRSANRERPPWRCSGQAHPGTMMHSGEASLAERHGGRSYKPVHQCPLPRKSAKRMSVAIVPRRKSWRAICSRCGRLTRGIHFLCLTFHPPPAPPVRRGFVVSASQTSPEGDAVRRLRRQVEHAIEQLAALSGSSLPPAEFYQELLRKGLAGIDAPAGAIWLKTPQGFLQQQCQHDLGKVGLHAKPDGRQAHTQLLRFAFDKKKPGLLGPRMRADGDRSAGNPTDYQLALAPILTDENDVLGILEIFQKPNWNQQDLITYTIHVAGYASNYLRNTSNRKVAGQEQVWTQLEVFSRQVHASLNPTEVAYVVANEGRRMIGCDRISVGIRHGRKVTIESVSGADVVEKASTHIRRMRDLF